MCAAVGGLEISTRERQRRLCTGKGGGGGGRFIQSERSEGGGGGEDEECPRERVGGACLRWGRDRVRWWDRVRLMLWELSLNTHF